MPPSPNQRLRKLSDQVRIMLAVFITCLAIVALDGWSLWHERKLALEDDGVETANLTRSLAQHMHDLVNTADTVLAGLQARAATGVDRERISAEMQASLATLPHLHSLYLYDDAGLNITAITTRTEGQSANPRAPGQTDGVGWSVTDRPYFKAHRDTDGLGLLVQGPFKSKVDGRWVMSLSRRVNGPDGQFGGLVTATLSLDALAGFYATFEPGAHGIIALVSSTGTMLARSPALPGVVGTSVAENELFKKYLPNAPRGSFRYTSRIDGVVRLGSYRQVDGLPFVLTVAHGLDDVLAEWWLQTRLRLALSVAVAVALFYGALRHSLLMRQRQQVEEQYRLLTTYSSDVITCLDLTGRRLFASPSFEQVTGWPVECAMVAPWGQLVHPEDRDMVQRGLDKLNSGERLLSLTYRYVRPDGGHVWVEARCHHIDGERGAEPQIICNVRDITARKIAEDKMDALNAELAARADTDGLTGLWNRRCFDEALHLEGRRMSREAAPLSLIMVDIDHFKRFNDAYGHPAGDRCIQLVADVVTVSVRRPGDIAARYGGEELAILLPSTDEAGALFVAEQIRARIEALQLFHEGNDSLGVVTASFGAATIVPGDDVLLETSALLDQADAALYQAKRGGRNRVVHHTDMPRSDVVLRSDEPQRLAAVAAIEQTISRETVDSLNRLAQLAASLFAAPIALVTVVGGETQAILGWSGCNVSTIPRASSFCAHAIAEQRVLVVTDAVEDERFRTNPLVTGDPGIRFYAGAPIRNPHGLLLGALCVIDIVPRPPLTIAQMALLTDMAALASNRIHDTEPITDRA